MLGADIAEAARIIAVHGVPRLVAGALDLDVATVHGGGTTRVFGAGSPAGGQRRVVRTSVSPAREAWYRADCPTSLPLARLRDEPRYLAALAALLVDEVLATPARRLVDPVRLTPLLVAGLQAVAAAPGHAAWLEQRLRDALGRIRPRPTTLRARIPGDLQPLPRTVVRRPYTPSRALVRAVVDQATTRDLSRTILHTTLLDFAKKVGSISPDTSKIPGAGVTSKLFGVAKGVASVVGLDASVEDRARLRRRGRGRVIDMIVDRVSDPKNAGEGAAFRADVLASLLDLPESAVHAELVKLDPAVVAADLHAALVGLAAWDRLPAEIEAALTEIVNGLGDADHRRAAGRLGRGRGVARPGRGRAGAPPRARVRRRTLRRVAGASGRWDAAGSAGPREQPGSLTRARGLSEGTLPWAHVPPHSRRREAEPGTWLKGHFPERRPGSPARERV